MHTERFSQRAGSYAASRPSYPLEAVDVLGEGLGNPSGLTVADLGAGTGISARLIASRGPRVFAIEPNAGMREAAAGVARIEWIDATAESTTLPDASVDVAAAFQAWHWFEHAAAVAEARRIVRPGGRLAVVYNERDERDPFTSAYGDIVRRYAQDATEARRAEALARFATIDPARTRRFDFVNVHHLDRAGVHARAASTSYLPRENERARAMSADIEALLDAYAVDGVVAMHLVTTVVRLDLEAGA
jgi:SAM-dependent methyltransferase